jgi:hypothetical protein
MDQEGSWKRLKGEIGSKKRADSGAAAEREREREREREQ